LRYDTPAALVAKLRSLRIEKAWAGSYEGLLHRDVGGVNLRLAESCREHGRGILVPFGSVNPTLPDWEEDLRRCHEDHKMPGVRLHPNYHDYTLDDPRFRRLLALAAERKLLVQLAASMEDPRTQHPQLQVPDVDLEPLPDLMKKVPGVKVLILNDRRAGSTSKSFASTPGVFFDMARVEGTDGVAKFVRGAPAGRVVFGSHAPFFIYESALIKVYESELTEAESRALFEQNATRLLSYTKQS
jgi:predicted TIM-barrel fold metal-dependent hydrolase